jgi:hypothetical protein
VIIWFRPHFLIFARQDCIAIPFLVVIMMAMKAFVVSLPHNCCALKALPATRAGPYLMLAASKATSTVKHQEVGIDVNTTAIHMRYLDYSYYLHVHWQYRVAQYGGVGDCRNAMAIHWVA